MELEQETWKKFNFVGHKIRWKISKCDKKILYYNIAFGNLEKPIELFLINIPWKVFYVHNYGEYSDFFSGFDSVIVY